MRAVTIGRLQIILKYLQKPVFSLADGLVQAARDRERLAGDVAAPAARNSIASAMSAGLAMRPSKVWSTIACLRSAGQDLVHGESTSPGATALTRTSGASARARFLVRLTSPALLAP